MVRKNRKPVREVRRRGLRGSRRDSSRIWNLTAQPRPLGLATNLLDNRTFDFIQTTNAGTVLTLGSAPTFGGNYFTVGTHIAEYARFGNLFGQYRFNKIEVWLEPSTAGTPGLSTPWYSVIDFSNANNPASLAQMMSYTNCVTTNLLCGHYHNWVPHTASLTAAGTGTGYQNITAPWVDFSDTSVEHFGIKLAGDSITTGGSNNAVINMMVRIHFSTRNPLATS